MTFAQAIARVRKGVQRDDLVDDYPNFVNEAVKKISQRKSWAWMKETTTVTITSGTKTVALPSNFKELQNLRPPVHIILDDPNAGGEIFKPVNVAWEEQEVRRLWMMGGMAWDVQTWIERTGVTTCSLNIASPAGNDLDFRVKFYGFIPALTANDSTNEPLTYYEDMVIERAKAIAFATINDFDAEDKAMERFGIYFQEAALQDNNSDIKGREARM